MVESSVDELSEMLNDLPTVAARTTGRSVVSRDYDLAGRKKRAVSETAH